MQGMDHSVHRYDFAPITGQEETDEGFLRVWCRAARAGTQLYSRSDGSQIREYRPPEEVGSPESLSTFGMKPVTWTHPPELLDSENTKKFQIGYSGSQVRYNNGFVEVALTITEKDAIDQIKRRDATEVSAGYKVDYDPTPGTTPDGEDYEGIQRNIRVNHIAVVPRGRAGPEVRLLMDRMDAADAVATLPPSEETAFQSVPSITGSSTMATVKFDGLEIDLPAPEAKAIQSCFRDMERREDSLKSEIADLQKQAESFQAEISTLKEAKEAAESRADALDAASLSQERLDALVLERLNTLTHLSPAFPGDYKFDGIDTATLYREAYKNLTGMEPKADAEAMYVTGVVDGILTARADSAGEEKEVSDPETEEEGEEEEEKMDSASSEARGDSTTALRNALGKVQRLDESPNSKYRLQLQEGWKQPLSAHK